MKGEYNIEIITSTMQYKINLKRKVELIMGDSASGKTTICDLITEYLNDLENENPTNFIKIKLNGKLYDKDSQVKIYVAPTNNFHKFQQGFLNENSIVFIDEEANYMYNSGFAKLVKQSTNTYYCLITRKMKKLDTLIFSSISFNQICNIYSRKFVTNTLIPYFNLDLRERFKRDIIGKDDENFTNHFE